MRRRHHEPQRLHASTLSSSLLLSWSWSALAQTDTRTAALAALKRAATYMDEVVSYRGGYVWSYAPDFSKQLGEMEAYRTMVWMQPPGTSSIGHVYLDAYHATGDERYYQAALRTAMAVKQAQRQDGGWNYIHDFAGEGSLKRWYNTIGRNGWRLEEFQHYYGNSTFDDATTAVAAQLHWVLQGCQLQLSGLRSKWRLHQERNHRQHRYREIAGGRMRNSAAHYWWRPGALPARRSGQVLPTAFAAGSNCLRESLHVLETALLHPQCILRVLARALPPLASMMATRPSSW